MPNIITNNVTWVSRGKRGHGSAYQSIGNPVPEGNTGAGSSLPVNAPSSESITYVDANMQQQTVVLAFVCVTNTADGNQVFFPGQNGSINVGNGDVTFTNIFVPTGGGPGGEPGVYIDAFDVNAGNFADDDFVSVTTDTSLNSEANNVGFVPSANAEDVQAFNSIHGVPFEQWLKVTGTETVSQEDLFIARQTSGVCFAFYKSPTQPSYNGPYRPSEEIYNWVSYGVMVDGGGPTGNGPVDPWNPYVRQLLAGMALATSANKVSAKLRNEVLSLAARQVVMAAEQISHQINAQAHTIAEEKVG